MNIGFDLDDTLTERENYAREVCLAYFKEEGKSFKLINENTATLLEMFDWTIVDYYEFVAKRGYQYLLDVPPKKDAKLVIDSLRNQGHKIFIITARKYLDPYGISKKWLENHGIVVDKIIAYANDKTLICKQNNIDFFVDDNIEVITDLIKNNFKAKLMKTFDTTRKTGHLPVVSTLTEYYNFIQEYIKLN